MDEKEKELVGRALSGDSAAFEQLILPYRRPLLILAYRMTGNMEDAMDIVQDTIIKCFQYLHRFNTDKNFRNWLFQISLNLARDALKKRHREKDLNQNCFHPDFDCPGFCCGEDAFNEEISTDLRIDINSCLSRLTARERQVFILRDLEGFSIKETARLLRLSGLSIRVNLSRARKKLREMISGKKDKSDRKGGKA